MRVYLCVSSLVFATLSLSGCASIFAGSSDNIRLVTLPQTQAQCTLNNERGTWSGSTQNNVIVKRSKTDLDVSCVDSSTGAQGKQTLISDAEPWAIGNIGWGLLLPIGLGIDWITGAAYDYPDNVIVEMSNSLAQTAPPATSYVDPQANSEALPVQQQPFANQKGIVAAPPVYIPSAQ